VEDKCFVHDRSMVGSILAVNLLASSVPNCYTKVGGMRPRVSKYFLAIFVNLFCSSEVPLIDMFAY
jgi:hypothetical protein